MKTLSQSEQQKIIALKARFDAVRARILIKVREFGPAAYQQGQLSTTEMAMVQGTYPQP